MIIDPLLSYFLCGIGMLATAAKCFKQQQLSRRLQGTTDPPPPLIGSGAGRCGTEAPQMVSFGNHVRPREGFLPYGYSGQIFDSWGFGC